MISRRKSGRWSSRIKCTYWWMRGFNTLLRQYSQLWPRIMSWILISMRIWQGSCWAMRLTCSFRSINLLIIARNNSCSFKVIVGVEQPNNFINSFRIVSILMKVCIWPIFVKWRIKVQQVIWWLGRCRKLTRRLERRRHREQLLIKIILTQIWISKHSDLCTHQNPKYYPFTLLCWTHFNFKTKKWEVMFKVVIRLFQDVSLHQRMGKMPASRQLNVWLILQIIMSWVKNKLLFLLIGRQQPHRQSF